MFSDVAPIPPGFLSEDLFIDRLSHELDLKAIELRYPSLFTFSISHEPSPEALEWQCSDFHQMAGAGNWEYNRGYHCFITLGASDVHRRLSKLEESVSAPWPIIVGARAAKRMVGVRIDARVDPQEGLDRLYRYLARCPAALVLGLQGSEHNLDSYEDLVLKLKDVAARRKAKSLPAITHLFMNWSALYSEDEDTYFWSRPFFDLKSLLIDLGSTLTHLDVSGRLRTDDLSRVLLVVAEKCTALQSIVVSHFIPQKLSEEARGQALMPLGCSGRLLSVELQYNFDDPILPYITATDWYASDRDILVVISGLARLACSDCIATISGGEKEYDLSTVLDLMQRS